jgi:hypothetical protein
MPLDRVPKAHREACGISARGVVANVESAPMRIPAATGRRFDLRRAPNLLQPALQHNQHG